MRGAPSAPPPCATARAAAGSDDPADGQLRRLDRLAYLLDSSVPIPGTRVRMGVDSLIGLLPGVGDVAGGLISAWIVAEAARMGAPRAVLARMAANVALETVIGTVPLAGDLFDVFFKANRRNVELLRKFVARDRPPFAGEAPGSSWR